MGKCLDYQALEIILKDEEIRSKTKLIETLRPTKQRKVNTNPNKLFYNIKQIKRI